MSDAHKLKVFEACCQISCFRNTPSSLIRDKTFLEQEENVELISQFIQKQTYIETLDISSFKLTDQAAHNILKLHYQKARNLTYIPKQLYNGKNFFKSEQNVDLLCECISRQRNLQQFDMDGIQINDDSVVTKIIQALSQNTNLTRISKEMFRNNTFLESRENVELLKQCMDKQKNMQNLDMNGLNLSDRAVFNLFSVYFIEVTNMSSIPDLISDTFLESEENIDVLCQFISRQRTMYQINIAGSKLNQNSLSRVLEAASKIRSLSYSPITLFQGNNLLETASNVQLIKQCIEKQKYIYQLDLNGIQISD